MRQPYVYFGGKRKVAHVIWERFGHVNDFIEPFFGGGACYLYGAEKGMFNRAIINDINCYITNFWRAIKHDPIKTAELTDFITSHVEVHARRRYFLKQKDELARLLNENDEYYDAKIAGYWCYVLANWIGGGADSRCAESDNVLNSNRNMGCQQKVPNAFCEHTVLGQVPLTDHEVGCYTSVSPLGEQRKFPPTAILRGIYDWFEQLSDLLRTTKIWCTDWKRMKHFINSKDNMACFFDPPYAVEDRHECYAHDDFNLAHEVREFALKSVAEGSKTKFCIAGYIDEFDFASFADWECYRWKAQGGYAHSNGKGNENRHKECLVFSPNCIKPNTTETTLFSEGDDE